MIRVEIYANVELMEELREKLAEDFQEYHYSLIHPISGYGKKGYALGDTTWPEMNFICVLMIQDNNPEIVSQLKSMCNELQEGAPLNSITIFAYRLESML